MDDGDEDNTKCIVCLEEHPLLMSSRKRAARMVPCGHLAICKSCFHRLDKCPMCRKRYRENEHVMTPAEEDRLVSKMHRLNEKRTVLAGKISELEDKRDNLEEEIQELEMIRERQRVLLRRRMNRLT